MSVARPAALLAELIACETAVWQALVSGDAEADRAALAADFLGVYPDGFAGRDAHAAQLSGGPTVTGFRLSDARLLPLGADHAILAYRADFRRTGRTDDEAMYVSSVWQRAPSGWVNIFSQDTPADGRSLP